MKNRHHLFVLREVADGERWLCRKDVREAANAALGLSVDLEDAQEKLNGYKNECDSLRQKAADAQRELKVVKDRRDESAGYARAVLRLENEKAELEVQVAQLEQQLVAAKSREAEQIEYFNRNMTEMQQQVSSLRDELQRVVLHTSERIVDLEQRNSVLAKDNVTLLDATVSASSELHKALDNLIAKKEAV